MRREFEARFPKIITRTEEEKKEAKEMLKKDYLEFRKKIAPYEISKIEREETLPIIEDMESVARKVLEKFKKKPEKPFPLERTRLLKQGGVEAYPPSGASGGFCNAAEQYIALDRTNSDVETVLIYLHERFHLASPTAIKITEGKAEPLWSGIVVHEHDKKGRIAQVDFGEIGEAIIDELTNQVYQKEIKKNSRYQKEVKDNERILRWIKKLAKWKGWDKKTEKIYLSEFYAVPEMVELIKKLEEGEGANWPYAIKLMNLVGAIDGSLRQRLRVAKIEKRVELAELLDEIFKKSKDPEAKFKFKNRQEIFDEFAKANFTANPLKIRRIIEGVLGKNAFKSFIEKQTRRTLG